ncbi:MAG: hypothetical protein JW956_10640 [Calditrichaceae bacterium]|nr:hypothetical protein [Calditrichaceae bacterium]
MDIGLLRIPNFDFHAFPSRSPDDIDLILDAGVMFNHPSTVVDFTQPEPEIIREGAGAVDALYY